ETHGYDAFGKPRLGNWSDKAPPIHGSSITDRGFTEHEHLDDWQLIHMNGRAYDYNLGRFLSIDPIIQSPGNSQSINPYAHYVRWVLVSSSGLGAWISIEQDSIWHPRVER
ncbi:MAG: RHS repeat-associated core domain-containing protein, partial [Woeseiaceae bacterium]